MEHTIITSTYRNRRKCSNCGKSGHENKFCKEPMISWGVINIEIENDVCESMILTEKFTDKKKIYIKVTSEKYPSVECYISDNNITHHNENSKFKLDDENIPYQNEDQIKKFQFYKDKILFMMVSRKYSLGFIEFLRGRYDCSDVKSIINLFEQMYDSEIRMIKKNQYDDMLYQFLNRNNESKETVLNRIYEGKYSSEYCQAKIKFNTLCNPETVQNNDVPLSLNFYVKYIKPKWNNLEWGFPKGRRDKYFEDNLSCACREFEEETGYIKDNYIILDKVEPLEELLTGTNGIEYKHVYYLSLNNRDRNIIFSKYDKHEIESIQWFTYNEAMNIIRPYHIEKKKVLTRIYLFLLNYLINYTAQIYVNN